MKSWKDQHHNLRDLMTVGITCAWRHAHLVLQEAQTHTSEPGPEVIVTDHWLETDLKAAFTGIPPECKSGTLRPAYPTSLTFLHFQLHHECRPSSVLPKPSSLHWSVLSLLDFPLLPSLSKTFIFFLRSNSMLNNLTWILSVLIHCFLYLLS